VKRCYLTGSKGFIGTYLRKYIEETGSSVVGTVDDWGAEYEIPGDTDVVYHLGALTRPPFSMQDRADYFYANVGGTVDLLDSVKKDCPGAKVVLFGSATQDHLDSWYAYTKAMADSVGEAYAKFYGMSVYRLRLLGVVGVGHVGDVVNEFAEQAVRNGRIRHGNLNVSRDISDVRDVVPAIVERVSSAKPGIHYIGRGSATPVDYLARWFRVPLERDATRVRVEDTTHVSPEASVRARPIEETLQWVLDDWRRRLS